MNSIKTERFAELFSTHSNPTNVRGRKHSAFATNPGGQTRFPASRSAYVRRLQHFKVLIAIDHDYPCIDPIAETKRHIGSVRRTLWLYLHECLPAFPGKAQGLAGLISTNNANVLTRGIEDIILKCLNKKMISDSEFADRVLDDTRLMDFAGHWFARKKGHRAL
jgi:hypothetical protein